MQRSISSFSIEVFLIFFWATMLKYHPIYVFKHMINKVNSQTKIHIFAQKDEQVTNLRHGIPFVSWTNGYLDLFELFVPFQLQNTSIGYIWISPLLQVYFSIGYIWISPLLQVYFSPWCTMTYGFSPQCTMTYPAEKREKVALTRSLTPVQIISLIANSFHSRGGSLEKRWSS